ncbi:hypothetical protein PFISCL1PPCAC_20926, partial [Pristionchus fissidentatus]
GVSKLTREHNRSPIKFFAGLPWRVMAGPVDLVKTGNTLALGVISKNESDDEWSAEADVTLTLLNADPTMNVTKQDVWKFCKESIVHGFIKFIPFQTVLDEAKGFIKDDKIVVEARIKVIKVRGVMKPLEFDFSTPSVGSDNIALIIEGEKVYVSKGYLSIHS